MTALPKVKILFISFSVFGGMLCLLFELYNILGISKTNSIRSIRRDNNTMNTWKVNMFKLFAIKYKTLTYLILRIQIIYPQTLPTWFLRKIYLLVMIESTHQSSLLWPVDVFLLKFKFYDIRESCLENIYFYHYIVIPYEVSNIIVWMPLQSYPKLK